MDQDNRETRPTNVDLGKGGREQLQGGRGPDREKEKPLFKRPEVPPPTD